VVFRIATEAEDPDVCIEDDPAIPDTHARRPPREFGEVLP
jgi:hypothetical protein